jgi:putative inorganic carbon (hco3(-)) transporter
LRSANVLNKIRADSPLEVCALAMLLAYVAIAPVPYGGITRGGMLALELFAFTTLALTFFGHPRLARLTGVKTSIAALIGIAILGIVQLLPMNVGRSATIYRDAATTLKAFGRPAPTPRISIAPTETWDTILLTLAYVALFVSAVLLLRSRTRRRLFAAVLLASALLQIVIAAAFREGDRIHGSFVNPNHFAGYLNIALAIAFGVLWREVLHYRDSGRRTTERARRFESVFIRVSLRIVLWGTIAAGLGLTQSRAGILVAVLVTLALLSIAPSHPRINQRRWSFAGAGAAIVAAAIGFTILTVRQQPIIRFLGSDPRDPASDLRLSLWRLSIDAWRNFPILGSGLGTFREAFRRVQPRDFNYYVEFAHSDPLQLLVTGGLIGFALGAIAMLALMIALLRRWHREQRREESAMLLGAFGAVLALALHGLVEFNLSIPAIPATLACVAGFGWAAAQGNDEDEERRQIRLVT